MTRLNSALIGKGGSSPYPASRRAGKLADNDVGRRLRIARESARFTQAEAAAAIKVARTTLVAVERGQRRARIEELQKLATLYGTSANAILRDEAVHVDLVRRFRKLTGSADQAVNEAVRLLDSLVRAETELKNVLGVKWVRRYPPERGIQPGDIDEQAERNAQELRDWLGLKTGPVTDIVSILDQQLGINVYIRKIDAEISGLFAYEENIGAFILLNAAHPFTRIQHSGAHELGHFYSTRRNVEVLARGENFRSREEKYAERFARSFLTPAREVAERFARITAGQSHFTRRHVILLAYESNVSREAMVRRLEELSLVKKGTWDWFQSKGGITDEQVKEVLGQSPPVHAPVSASGGVVPPRLSLLVREAWKRGLYSEGQLARLLSLTRYEIREVLDGVELEQSEANDLVKLSG